MQKLIRPTTLFRHLLLIPYLVLLTASLTFSQNIKPTQITLSSGEWPPYLSQLLKGGGPIARVVTESFALEGIKVNYKYSPWLKSMDTARIGQTAGTLGWTYSKERERFFKFGQPILITRAALFYLADKDYTWNKLSDLKDLRLGKYKGAFDGKEIESIIKEAPLDTVTYLSEQKGIYMLLNGDFDVMLSNFYITKRIVDRLLTSREIAMIKWRSDLLPPFSLHLLISREHPHADYLLDAFNRGIKKLHKSGRYYELIFPLTGPISTPLL